MTRKRSDDSLGRAAAQSPSPKRVTRAPGVLGKNIYRTVKIAVKVEAAGLIGVFGWLKLQGAEFAPFAKQLSASIVFKFSLALYFTCWVTGVLRDTDAQESIYASQPNDGRVPLIGFIWLFLLAAVFGLFCWAGTGSFEKFAPCLTLFFVINIMTWRYLVKGFLPKTVAESKRVFQKNPFKLEKVLLVYDRYLCGRWQVYRFIAGGTVLLLLNLLVFSPLGVQLASLAGLSSPDLIVSGTVLLFVVLMEAWIWLVRDRIRTALSLLDYLDEHYGDPVGWAIEPA